MKAYKVTCSLLRSAQRQLESLPCALIGSSGATQSELDGAIVEGKVIYDDAMYHQGQQAWLYIEQAIKLLRKEK